ncbi:Fur family transcriptional regulator [Limosilactobacillus caecicola]|uniref:Fur family transcriptional regulator n=1 Tax=Limosilactobacillus caecicola TaxID=2941332 RepID=UPI00203B03DC|nr:Fur family transcriptional regulator [Limosilactobacillus caecicola]
MADTELQHALKRLKDNHVRLTPQRKIILNYLITHHTHPTVEMILADLRKHDAGISMATVYNTVKLLVDYNLVIELKNGDGSTHYDYFGHPHYHVVCDNCGKITDVNTPEFSAISKELADVTRRSTGYLVTRSDVEVHGICPDCQYKLGLNNNKGAE